MWRQQGRHRTGTTGGNSLHPTQQWMEHDDDEKDKSLPGTCGKLDLPWMERRLQETRRTNATDIDTATSVPDGGSAALIWLSGDETLDV